MQSSVSRKHTPLPDRGTAAAADALPAIIPSAWRLLVQQCRAQQPELRPTVPGLLAQLHHLLALIPTPPALTSTPAVNSTGQTLTAKGPALSSRPGPIVAAKNPGGTRTVTAPPSTSGASMHRYRERDTLASSSKIGTTVGLNNNHRFTAVPPTSFPSASLRRTQSARYAEVATEEDSALVAGGWEAMPASPQRFGVLLHNSNSTSCIDFLNEEEASFDAAGWGVAAVGPAISAPLQKEDSKSSTDPLMEEESYSIAPSRAILAAGELFSALAPNAFCLQQRLSALNLPLQALHYAPAAYEYCGV